MAEDVRRAARHEQYELREIVDGSPPVDLGTRAVAGEYVAAIDRAFELLDGLRPGRALRIVRVRGDEREIVWSYPAPTGLRDLVEVWGFDVTRNWGQPQR